MQTGERMPIAATDIAGNQLLAALPPEDLERWRYCLESVELTLGQVLQESHERARYAYFPVDAVASLQVQSGRGDSDEVAVVGREGMVGVSTFADAVPSSIRVVVRRSGRAWRLSAECVQAGCEASAAVLRLLLHYVLSRDAQIAQEVACSRHHTVEQRLCLKLLLATGQQKDGQLAMTHEQLSLGLGVRRESVTEAAIRLQEAGLIAYSRGRITILDRAALAQRSCECYELMQAERQHGNDAGPSSRLPGAAAADAHACRHPPGHTPPRAGRVVIAGR